MAFFASKALESVLTFATDQDLPNDYYVLDIPAMGPLVTLQATGNGTETSLNQESLGQIAQGYGTTVREEVYLALNQGQVDTLLVQADLDERGIIALSTHTILEQYRQASPYDGDRVSVAPLREILVFEALRHKGKVRWLKEELNGKTPHFAVVYRGHQRKP